MSRLDKFEEILKSYDGKTRLETEETVLLFGKPLLKSDYDALETILAPSHISPKELKESAIEIENKRITILDISNLSLALSTDLAKEIGQLNGLYTLCLTENRIAELPESIGLLENLTRLYINKNRLISLPDSMENLKKLKHIDIDHNQFIEMPAVLLEMPELKVIHTEINPMDYENDPILKQLEAKGIIVLGTWEFK